MEKEVIIFFLVHNWKWKLLYLKKVRPMGDKKGGGGVNKWGGGVNMALA